MTKLPYVWYYFIVFHFLFSALQMALALVLNESQTASIVVGCSVGVRVIQNGATYYKSLIAKPIKDELSRAQSL